MKVNEGTIDRAVRLVLAAAAGVAVAVGAVSGTAAAVVGGLGAILAITGLVGVCPAYKPLGLSTKKGEAAASKSA